MDRHRFFLVPTRPDVPVDEAVAHWERQHGEVFAATPDLGGYVQHRPTAMDQRRLGGRVCAEAWFVDRAHEARAWGSDHYRDVVTTDEGRFADRSRAWAPRVLAEHRLGPVAPDGAVEVVAVGCDPAALPPGVSGRALAVDREGPGGGPASVLVLQVATAAHARSLVDQLPADTAFVATRAAILPPS